jgi:hypothetical protein
MTTFEIIVSIGIIAIVGLKILDFTGMATTYAKMKEGFECLAKKIEYCESQLGRIRGVGQDISQQLENIEDDILDDLRDIRLADKLGKTSPNVPAALPCYAPNGICTNPQMDCINCPKRSAGGTWSTSTNTINKED